MKCGRQQSARNEMTIIESLKKYENAAAVESESSPVFPSSGSDGRKWKVEEEMNELARTVRESRIRQTERDGYIRKSPVQDIYTPETYYRGLLIKTILGVLAAMVLSSLLILFWKLGILSL